MQYECLVKTKILPGKFPTFHDELVLLVGLVHLDKFGAIPFSVPIWKFHELMQLQHSSIT